MYWVPIVLSFVVILIATLALGWNIYRDVYSKARVKVWASRSMILMVGRQPLGPFLSIDVTNMGPGIVVIEMIVFRNERPWFKPFDRSGGVIAHDWENPLSSKLPRKLEVGERLDLLLGWSDADENYVLKHPVAALGVRDSFGRRHWVPRKQLGDLKEKFAEEFPN